MAEEEKNQDEKSQAGASDEVAEEAAEPAATSEPEPAGSGGEAEQPADDEVAEEAAEPESAEETEPEAAKEEAPEEGAAEPEAGESQAEASGGVDPDLDPKARRRLERSRASGPPASLPDA